MRAILLGVWEWYQPIWVKTSLLFDFILFCLWEALTLRSLFINWGECRVEFHMDLFLCMFQLTEQKVIQPGLCLLLMKCEVSGLSHFLWISTFCSWLLERDSTGFDSLTMTSTHSNLSDLLSSAFHLPPILLPFHNLPFFQAKTPTPTVEKRPYVRFTAKVSDFSAEGSLGLKWPLSVEWGGEPQRKQ